jgi:hypothetical protein
MGMTNSVLAGSAVRLAGSCRIVMQLAAAAGVILAAFASPALAASTPTLTPFAGDGLSAPAVPGPALSTHIPDPEGIGVDADGNVYVTEGTTNRILKITPDGTLSVFAGNGTIGVPVAGPALSSPMGYHYAMTVDPAGNVIVGDYDQNQIDKITPDGTLSIIAGNGSLASPSPGPALSSPLPPIYSLAADAAGNVYFEDAFAPSVWKVAADGTLSRIAGNGTAGAVTPGPALATTMETSYGGFAVAPDGTVYADSYNGSQAVVFKVTPAGMISIVAGNGPSGPPVPGPATATPIGQGGGVALDAAGNLYHADMYRFFIEKVTPDGTLSIVAGDGSPGAPIAGPPTASPLEWPVSLALDSAGTIYVTANWSRVIRIGSAEPSAPRNLVATPGADSVALAFDPPVTPGTSPITGYEVNTDGGATWHALTTAPGMGSRLTATLAGLDPGGSYALRVRAINASGSGDPAASAVQLLAVPSPPPAAAAAPAGGAQTVVSVSPFVVAVRFRLPASCARGCTITKAALALRDGTLLGTRRNLTVTHAGWVRFTVAIDKAALLAAGAQLLKPGWRTTQTRFTVATRAAGGTRWARVKDGHITVSLARLASGRLPIFPAML